MLAFPIRVPHPCMCSCQRNLANHFARNCCRRSKVRRVSCRHVNAHGRNLTYRNVSPASLLALPRLAVVDALDQLLHVGTPFFKWSSLLYKLLPCESVFCACTECAYGRCVNRIRHQHVNKPSVSCSPVIEEVYGWQCAMCSPLFATGQIAVSFTEFGEDLVAGHAIRSYCACFTKSEI